MEWFKTRLSNNKKEVFDPIRRKYVALTPEEEVRQLCLHALVNQYEVPTGLIAVEYSVKLHTLAKRADIVVFGRSGTPLMIVECKAESVQITEDVLHQLLRYHAGLTTPFLLITNGRQQLCLKTGNGAEAPRYLDRVPIYSEMEIQLQA